MKQIRWFLLMAGLLSSLQLLQAQTTQTDSIVQITADLQGLQQIAYTDLPFFGTYYEVLPGGATVPLPTPTFDPTLPIYSIAGDIYLVDATGGQMAITPRQTAMLSTNATALVQTEANALASLIERVQAAQAPSTMTMMTMSTMDSPAPPGFDSSGTNSYSPDGLTNSYSAPDYGTNLWIANPYVAAGQLNGTGSNTIPGVEYEVQSRTNLMQTDWQHENFIWGSDFTNWTPLSVTQNGRTNLFLRLKSFADDGSGLPIWWQLQFFGYVGVDPNADPMGDGWSNIQKYQNGMNPNVFYTPAAPEAFTAVYNADSDMATLSWSPSFGNVTGYTLKKIDYLAGGITTTYLSSSTVNYSDTIRVDSPSFGTPFMNVGYTLQAQYGTNGLSSTASASLQYMPAPQANILWGTQGYVSIVMPNPPTDLSNVWVYRQESDGGGFGASTEALSIFGPNDAIFYVQPPLTNGYFSIPASAITNGVFQIPGVQAPALYEYGFWIQTVRSNGIASSWSQLSDPDFGVPPVNTPFLDERQQLKDNLRFLLRAADDAPFAFVEEQNWGGVPVFDWPGNYIYSDCYGAGTSYADGYFLPLLPTDANVFLRNFVFDQTRLTSDGFLNTGCYGDGTMLTITNLPTFYFNWGYYLSNNIAFPSSILPTNQTQWLLPNDGMIATLNGGTVGGVNYYGLTNLSFKCAYVTNNQLVVATYNRGQTLPSGVNGVVYTQTAQPVFTNTGYYFARPNYDPMPSQSGFYEPDAPIIFQGVGTSQEIAGYSRLGIQNGKPGTYAYLGQYFQQAYQVDTNGNVTANPTGILSPYGKFFATQPGTAALVTMPDIDTGEQGTCMVYCVSLQLDANHDGKMDLSYTGTDATSPNSPFVIWANDNYDRWHTVDDIDFEQDDLGAVSIAKLPADQQVPDFQFTTNGQPAIPCTRDLEDYFRMWTPGVAALMQVLPSNYSVQFTLTGGGQISIFQAIEPDGGTNYLFDEMTASNQVANSTSLYIGLLTSNSPVVLSTQPSFNEHFIFCGAQRGSAQIDLQILDGNQNVVADASAYLQIKNIKEMYERWTVGDNPNNPPINVAVKDMSDLPPLEPAFAYPAPQDTNTPYILFVHGWNMERWEKDRFAEAAFKRLYWQGYNGRFGIFRWPTHNGFGKPFSGSPNTPLNDPRNYDNSESNAWASATGLLNKLYDLDAIYSSHVYVMAHSMGNVVTGEALRLAGTNQVVNTYIAMQGALSAHCYDASTPSLWTFGPADMYAHYWTSNSPCYFNATAGAGNYVNFFNTNDWALNADHWQLDQYTKPDSGYTYNPYFGLFDGPSGLLYMPTNTYEVFAYADPARSYALGAQANVGGVFQKLGVSQQINLQSIWPSDTHPNHDYSEHVWHSAQFRSDNPSRSGNWNAILGHSGFNLK